MARPAFIVPFKKQIPMYHRQPGSLSSLVQVTMFYSADILGKRTPLGLVWLAANGNRINKGQIIGANLQETVSQIINNVPFSLRTHAILVNGVVVLYNRQSGLLLDDARGILRKVVMISGSLSHGNVTSDELARVEDITLPEHPISAWETDLDLADLFPIFPGASSLISETRLLLRAPAVSYPKIARKDRKHSQVLTHQSNDDDMGLVFMPSLPDHSQGRSLAKAPGEDVRIPFEYHIAAGLDAMAMHDAMPIHNNPEIFDAPDLQFEFDLLDVNADGFGFASGPEAAVSDKGAGPNSHKRQRTNSNSTDMDKEGLGMQLPKTPTSTREKAKRTGKSRKPTVDGLITIPSAVYRGWLSREHYSQLMVRRPCRSINNARNEGDYEWLLAGPFHCKTGHPSTILLRSEDLHEKWLSASGAQALIDTVVSAGDKKKGNKRTAAVREEEEEKEDFPVIVGGGSKPSAALYVLANYEDSVAFEDNPFNGLYQSAAAAQDPSLGDFETERLRAALHGGASPGDFGAALMYGGNTPRSEPRSRSKRAGSLAGILRHESEGGLLSDRSSDRNTGSHQKQAFTDGGGLEALEEEEDLGAMLPSLGRLGEDSPFGQQIGSMSRSMASQQRLTGFELIEESGRDTQLSLPNPRNLAPQLTRFAMVLRSMFAEKLSDGEEACVGLLAITKGRLNRRDAALAFSHFLAAKTAGYVEAAQFVPYGEIEMTPGPEMVTVTAL